MEQTALFNALTQALNNLTSSGTSHHDETATQIRETRVALMMLDNDINMEKYFENLKRHDGTLMNLRNEKTQLRKEIRELTEQLIALRKDIGKEKNQQA